MFFYVILKLPFGMDLYVCVVIVTFSCVSCKLFDWSFEPQHGNGSSFRHYVQTGFGAHPFSHLRVTWSLSPGVEWRECESDHSSACSCISILRNFSWGRASLSTAATWLFKENTYHCSNILTNQMQQFYMFITRRFVSLNMFRAPPRPSSGAYNCINSLWFYLGAWW
jgi:hypothetical protein